MKYESLINLGLGAAVAIGFIWTQIKSIPRLEERVSQHDVRLAVIENKLDTIKDGVGYLVRSRQRDQK